jgi:hypothetical protein
LPEFVVLVPVLAFGAFVGGTVFLLVEPDVEGETRYLSRAWAVEVAPVLTRSYSLAFHESALAHFANSAYFEIKSVSKPRN